MRLNKFKTGLGIINLGIRAIKNNKGLWKWVLIPLLIDFVLLMFLLFYGFSSLTFWVTSALGFIFSDPTGWLYSLLYYPLLIALSIGFFVITLFVVYVLASAISSPFYSIIVERILISHGEIQDRPFDMSRWLAVSIKMMFVSLLRAFIFGFFGIALFLGSFIPGLNVLTSFLAFLLISFDGIDYTYETLEFSFRERINHFKSNIMYFNGIACVIGLTLFIPGLTLMLMPFFTAGASEIYCIAKREQIES